MIFDLIAALVLGLAAWRGWVAGLLVTALSFGGILVGYVLGYSLAGPLGDLIASASELPSLIVYPATGFTVVMAVMFAAAAAKRKAIKKREGKIDEGWEPPPWDRWGGATLAAGWAAMLVLLAAWVLVWIQSMASVGPNVRDSVVGGLATRMVGSVVGQIAESKTGNLGLGKAAAAFVNDPKAAAGSLSKLLKDPRVRQMVQDRDVSAIDALARDPELLRQAHGAGLLAEDPSQLSPQEAATQLQENLAPIAKTAERLSKDPEIKKLLSDPKTLSVLQSGNPQVLLTDPRFERLAKRVMEAVREEGASQE